MIELLLKLLDLSLKLCHLLISADHEHTCQQATATASYAYDAVSPPAFSRRRPSLMPHNDELFLLVCILRLQRNVLAVGLIDWHA